MTSCARDHAHARARAPLEMSVGEWKRGDVACLLRASAWARLVRWEAALLAAIAPASPEV